MVIAVNALARKPFFPLPNEVFDDPYFTREKRAFSRVEALAWIANHVRWTDNCVLKRGQGSWSLSYLAEAWGWLRSKVQRFLKRLESMNLVQLMRDKAADTAQTIISYVISMGSGNENPATDTDPIQQRYSSDTKTNTGNKEKKDSPVGPQGDTPAEDPFDPSRWQTVGDDGAGPSNPAHGAGNAKSDNTASDDAGPSKKIPRKKVSRAIPSEWRPRPETQAWARNGKIGATDAQIAEQVEEFIRHFEANGKSMKDWDKAFQNWISRAKKWGQLEERKPAWQSAREREFVI